MESRDSAAFPKKRAINFTLPVTQNVIRLGEWSVLRGLL